MFAHFGPNLQFPWSYTGGGSVLSSLGHCRAIPVIVTYLGEVLTNVLRSRVDIVAEGTGISSLTLTLAEELAGDVRGVWRGIHGKRQGKESRLARNKVSLGIAYLGGYEARRTGFRDSTLTVGEKCCAEECSSLPF